MDSKTAFEKAKSIIPGGVHSPVRSFKGLHTTPRFMEKAKAATITDIDGKTYIDFCMSFGPLILGHADDDVKAELTKALERGWSYGASERYSLELAEFIVNKISFIDQIRFVNSGTEAVMTALRLARGFTNRDKILKFNGCYHGHVDSMLIKAGSGLAGTGQSSSAGVPRGVSDNTLILELDDEAALEECFVREGNKIAAIIIEPLPANNGLLPQRQEYLNKLRTISKKYGALLIFDEVITGFRIGMGGMAEKLGITPDLVTYGKVIGGGMPVGAIAGRKEIMQSLAPVGEVYQAGTLSANPLAMIAGLATLKKCTPQFYIDLNANAQRIAALFKEWLETNEYGDYKIICEGSLFWATPSHSEIRSLVNIPGNLTTRFYNLFKNLLDRGIYFAPNAYEVGFVSIAHDKEVYEQLKARLF